MASQLDNRLLGYRFPGDAGQLQLANDVQGLVSELADGYDQYHAVLREDWSAAGGRPDPVKYSGALPAYLEACTVIDRLIAAEAFLRYAVTRKSVERDADPAVLAVPFVDTSWNLVHLNEYMLAAGLQPGRPLPPHIETPALPER